MQNYRIKISLLVLVVATIYASCRKADSPFERTTDDKTKTDLTEQFFSSKPGSSMASIRVLDEIRKRNNQLGFVSEFARTNGLPLWHEAIVTQSDEDPSHNFGNTVQGGDTIVYIPLVLANTQYTNGFIRAILNDTISISNWVAGDYTHFPVSAAAGETTRNQYAAMIMLMDNQVFGATKFRLTDSTILLPPGAVPTGYERLAKIASIDTVSGSNLCTGTIYNVTWLVQDAANCNCTNGASSPGGHCSDWQTGCTACSNTVSITIQVGDGGCGGGVSTPPTPTNPTGGSNGGTWNTGPTGGGGTGGGPVGWVPFGDELTPAQELIASQLNTILKPGDSYYFMYNLNSSNSLSFPSVAAFQSYLESNANSQNIDLSASPTVINQNEKIEYGKFNLTFIGGVEIACKLTKSTTTWDVANITSSDYGVTIGWEWEQSDYTKSIAGNEITIMVSGYIKYNIIFDGVGTLYKEKNKFQVKINKVTGKITSLSKG